MNKPVPAAVQAVVDRIVARARANAARGLPVTLGSDPDQTRRELGLAPLRESL